MSIRTSPGTPRSGTVPGGYQATGHQGGGVVGLGDTWEVTERCYFPSRRSTAGVVLRIDDFRWVSIGNSTAEFIGSGFDAEPVADAFGVYRYGATLWENHFDGELRRIQQVDLFSTYDDAHVSLDTTDGYTWAAAGLRQQASGALRPRPRWSVRKLVVDPVTGALSTGPLAEVLFPGATGQVYAGGGDFGLASLTTNRAILFASVGNPAGTGQLYAVAVDLDSGALGPNSSTIGTQLGWTPAPQTEGSAFGVNAAGLSSTDALVLLNPANVGQLPALVHMVIEAHFDANAALVSTEDLVNVPYPTAHGALAGAALIRPQLNMVFCPAVTLANDTYAAYAWINGERVETPELIGYNTSSFFNPADLGPDGFAHRYLDWYGDADYPNGTVGQEMRFYIDSELTDFALVRYPPRTTLLELERIPEHGFWFNTLTEYLDEDLDDFADMSPGTVYERYIRLLHPALWCGVHVDSPGLWPSVLGTKRFFVATWGTGSGSRAASTHELGTTRIQRGVR